MWLLSVTPLYSSPIEQIIYHTDDFGVTMALNSTVKKGGVMVVAIHTKQTIDNLSIRAFKRVQSLFIIDNIYYGMIPISFYAKKGKQSVQVSYTVADEKAQQQLSFTITEGRYKTTKISINKNKIDINKPTLKRIAKERQKALSIYAHKDTVQQFNASFIYPLKGKLHITSYFGNKRLFNGKIKSFHSGNDLRSAMGNKVYAINDGIVALTDDRFYAGKSVIINHGKGLYSQYYHLQDMVVEPHSIVKKGELLGYSGASGRVSGPHLHFGIMLNGKSVDSMALLQTIERLQSHFATSQQ